MLGGLVARFFLLRAQHYIKIGFGTVGIASGLRILSIKGFEFAVRRDDARRTAPHAQEGQHY